MLITPKRQASVTPLGRWLHFSATVLLVCRMALIIVPASMLWRELDERVYMEQLQSWRAIVLMHWNKYAYSWVPGTNNHQGKFYKQQSIFFIIQKARSLKSRALSQLVHSGEWECILEVSPGPDASQKPSAWHSLACRGIISICLCCHCFLTFYLCVHNSSFNGITTVGPIGPPSPVWFQ